MDTAESVTMAQELDPDQLELLDRIEIAEQAWRRAQARERSAKIRRDAYIRLAHEKGCGYGTIAKRLGVDRSTVQTVIGGRR